MNKSVLHAIPHQIHVFYPAMKGALNAILQDIV